MPFPNFHAARVKDPKAFQNIVVLQTLPNGIMIYGGKLKGETKSSPQSYRFPKTKFTVAEAKAWLKEHDISVTMFEEASEKKDEYEYEYEYERHTRIDYFPSDDLSKQLKFQKNTDGTLKGEAIITNVGVFPYLMTDGTVINELRLPEEVFHPDSVNSLKNKPLTNNHPPEIVTDDNVDKYQVGNIDDNVLQDQYHLAAGIHVTDEQAVNDIQDGKRALSAGYSVDLEKKSGVWMGVKYDAIQRNIQYNHVAIVDRGRAGDDAKIKLDSIDPTLGILHIEKKQNFNKREDKSMLKKIRIDGVEWEADAEVIKAYTQATSEIEKLKNDHTVEIESLKKDNDTITAERDQLKEDNEKLKKLNEEIQKDNPEVIEKAVQSRLVVLDAAKRADVEVKTEMSEDEIKKEIIIKLFPNSVEKLDGASEDYINARFDFALESLEEIKEDKKDTDTKLKNDSISNVDDKKEDSKSAYERMVKRDQESWKQNLKEVD
jgi:hypothetical protein